MIMDKSFIFGEAHNLSHSEVDADTFPEFKKVKFRYSAIHSALLFMLLASSTPALAATCLQGNEVGIGTALGGGNEPVTCSTFSIAIGGGSGATADDYGVAIGDAAEATFRNSVALGRRSMVNADRAISVGAYTRTFGYASIAIGENAQVTDEDAMHGIALGHYSQVEKADGIAIGFESNSGGLNAISIGAQNKVTGDNSGAIGSPSSVSGTGSYSLGNNNTVAANNAFTLGNNISIDAGLNGAIALGNGSSVQAAVATGSTDIDGNTYNFAGATPATGSVLSIGAAGAERQITYVAAGRLSATSTDAVNGSQLFATNSAVNTLGTKVGQNTTDITNLTGSITDVQNLINSGNVAVRYFSTGSTATGADSVASGLNSVAIGQASTATEADSIALGNGADAKFANSLALGANSVTKVGAESSYNAYRLTAPQTSVGEVAFGTASGNRKLTGIAAGSADNDAVNVAQLTAVGTQVDQNTSDITNLTGDVLNIINNGAPIKFFSTGTATTGVDSTASGSNSVAIGQASTATEEDSIALGNGADAKFANSLALGANSVTKVGAETNYNAYRLTAPQTSIGEVAFGTASGNRKLTGIAAGSADNDAVNVAQLTAVGNQVDQNTTDITTLFSNVSGGNFAVKFFSTGSAGTGTDSVASGLNSVAICQASTATEEDSVAFGNGADAGFANSLALGANSVTKVGAESGYTAYRLTASQTSVGEVAFGTASGNRKLTGIAAGSADNDAVNVAQLTAVGNQVDQNTTDITTLFSSVSGGNFAVKFFSTGSAGTGTDSVASGLNSVAIGQASTATEEDSVAFGNGADAGFANSLALGANSVTKVGAESGYNAYRLTASQTSVGEVAFGTASGNRKLTGIAAGTANNDAVNVEQLMAVGGQVDQNTSNITSLSGRVTSIENLFGSGEGLSTKYFSTNSTAANSSATGSDAIAVGPSAQATGNNTIAMGSGAQAQADGSVALGQNASDGNRGAESYTGKYSGASNNSVGTVSVGNAASGEQRTVSNVADGVQSNDAVNVRQLDGAVAVAKQYTDDSIANLENNAGQTNVRVAQLAVGTEGVFRVENAGGWENAAASGKNSVAGGAAATATAKESTALGTNSHATHESSVALGTNSVTDRANSVSVGSVGHERQVTNVAAATKETDAVNLAQFNRGMAESAGYTDRRFNQLQSDMNRQDRRLSAGIASAMAMASLPQPNNPGASMISIGGASYRGQSGISFGLSHLSEDGRWVTKAQLNNNSQNNVGWGVGVGYQF